MDTEDIDLADLDTLKASEEGAEIELMHPFTDKPLGQFIKILGQDSAVFRAHKLRAQNDARTKAFAAQRRNKPVEPTTAEEDEASGLKLLVAMTVDFHNIKFQGDVLQFSPVNAEKLYIALPWVAKQIDRAIMDLENFIKS